MNILEYCYTLISYCYRKKKIVREKENIPQPKRNQYSENEPKIFIFEKPFEKPVEKTVSNNYIVVNQSDDEEEYDIV